jgi:hypothetical protein
VLCTEACREVGTLVVLLVGGGDLIECEPGGVVVLVKIVGFISDTGDGLVVFVCRVWGVTTVVPGVDLVVADAGRGSVGCVSTFFDSDVVWLVCVRS